MSGAKVVGGTSVPLSYGGLAEGVPLNLDRCQFLMHLKGLWSFIF
jgi:hypothetical protein